MASEAFAMNGRVTVITGGGGFLGSQHAEAAASAGSSIVLADLDLGAAKKVAERISSRFGVPAVPFAADVSDPASVRRLLKATLKRFGTADVLINNAALDPKVGSSRSDQALTRLENFPLAQWNREMAVGLTGAFLCSQTFGAEMAKRGRGVILNISSDLSVIAPDQRIYRKRGLPENLQPVKPVTYSVLKAGLIGLTRYLSSYWAGSGIRVNAISPGGVRRDQPREFVRKLSRLIPLGRMAAIGEYRSAVLFLISDASSYMTGVNLVVDGGRSVW